MVFEQVNINNKHKHIVNIFIKSIICFYLEDATVSILKK